MPARPSVPGVCEVVVSGQLSGLHNWLNKLHVRYSGGPPSTVDLANYSDGIMTSAIANLIPLMATATTIDDITVTDISSPLGNVGHTFAVTPGTRAGGEIPGSAAYLISFRIGRHYRGGHPRMYLPLGVTTDLLTQATWQVAFNGNVAAGWAAFHPSLLAATGGFTPVSQCQVSYFGGVPPVGGHSVPRAVPLVDDIAPSAFNVGAEIASQRRRIGRG